MWPHKFMNLQINKKQAICEINEDYTVSSAEGFHINGSVNFIKSRYVTWQIVSYRGVSG